MAEHDPQLPAHVLAAALEAAGAEPEQRAEAFAEDRGRREHLPDYPALALITVRLTDLGPVGAHTPGVDPEHARPDVVCDLRPSEARQLAAALLDLADRIDPPPTS
jgi:hypothetical protein